MINSFIHSEMLNYLQSKFIQISATLRAKLDFCKTLLDKFSEGKIMFHQIFETNFKKIEHYRT